MADSGIYKKLVRVFSCRATDLMFAWRHRRIWLDKRANGRLHHDYFDDYRSRGPIADAVADLVPSPEKSFSVLEFGCSGGNNLRLLRERISTPFRYCGLDIQEDAIAFARSHFPEDTFYTIAGDIDSIRRLNLAKCSVFLASGVLHYLPQSETQTILQYAAGRAEYLVVCDITERFNESTGQNDGLFLHPYRKMCEQAGFSIAVEPTQKLTDRYSIFVARAAQH